MSVTIGHQLLEGRSGHEVGRQLLQQLYREKTGEVCPKILTTPRGKPYFEDSPLHFSISHTKSHAFCALAPHPVGIDAEEKDRKIDLRLADKILSDSERARYEQAEDKQAALLRFWVLKEAAAKLTGEGLSALHTAPDAACRFFTCSLYGYCLTVCSRTAVTAPPCLFYDGTALPH